LRLSYTRVKSRTILKIKLHLLQGSHWCGEEKIKVGRSGTEDKGMTQENKEIKKRKIKENMYYRPKNLDIFLIFKAY
jgi:hypothetical protein